MDTAELAKKVDQVIFSLTQQSQDDPSTMEKVPAPMCFLDYQTYDLLVRQANQENYSILFTKAVQALREVVTREHIHQSMIVIKTRRAGGKHHAVHTKIGKKELTWIVEQAQALETKPSRVMETVLFLFLRIDQ